MRVVSVCLLRAPVLYGAIFFVFLLLSLSLSLYSIISPRLYSILPFRDLASFSFFCSPMILSLYTFPFSARAAYLLVVKQSFLHATNGAPIHLRYERSTGSTLFGLQSSKRNRPSPPTAPT